MLPAPCFFFVYSGFLYIILFNFQWGFSGGQYLRLCSEWFLPNPLSHCYLIWWFNWKLYRHMEEEEHLTFAEMWTINKNKWWLFQPFPTLNLECDWMPVLNPCYLQNAVISLYLVGCDLSFTFYLPVPQCGILWRLHLHLGSTLFNCTSTEWCCFELHALSNNISIPGCVGFWNRQRQIFASDIDLDKVSRLCLMQSYSASTYPPSRWR